ncbi:hypothetical protein NMY3_00361 [Candidatus Nitrosocosmicus oleophilus]|uniref:PsbP C-terminal domain-containing protein n=1 Tax=Candidatus Nitrosocosmicus oleophilus TaxID=1353260 RepID=A0A654LTK4_9ARCH|nr:hypothetical protein [Candidatus Nitrosocosmicus oleophilus]ALI34575.1 hypothetical protein NMY3_00361 [Candidatus Nitrosocosmicus oleophilus]
MFILDNGNSKLLFPFTLIVFISTTMLFTSFDTYLVSAQPTENMNENFIPYENTDYGIKIQYPYNWKNTESLDQNSVATFSAPEIREKKSSTLINIYNPAHVILAVENISSSNLDLNDFTNKYLNRLSTINTEFQINNITDGTLAGKPAKIIFSKEMDILNRISDVMRIFTISDGVVYRINYVADPKWFSEYMPVAQKMIGSYEIISQPKNNLNPVSSALTTTTNQTQISNSGDISNFTNPATSSTTAATTIGNLLPENLVVTDNTDNNARLPLRFVTDNSGITTETNTSGVPEGSVFGYNPVLTFHFVERPNIGIVKINDLIMGQIKTYDSLSDILEGSQYWKDIPLNDEVVLRLDNAGLHYLVASVQFSNGTSGIYSSVVDVESDQRTKSGSDSELEREQDNGANYNVIDSLNVEDILNTPVFYQKSSTLICSHLSLYGFKICEEGAQNSSNNGNLDTISIIDSNNENDEDDEDNNNDENENNSNDDDDDNDD